MLPVKMLLDFLWRALALTEDSTLSNSYMPPLSLVSFDSCRRLLHTADATSHTHCFGWYIALKSSAFNPILLGSGEINMNC